MTISKPDQHTSEFCGCLAIWAGGSQSENAPKGEIADAAAIFPLDLGFFASFNQTQLAQANGH